jgi:ABC-type dipeptide/oligopeptide/nickel transport system permease component
VTKQDLRIEILGLEQRLTVKLGVASVAIISVLGVFIGALAAFKLL